MGLATRVGGALRRALRLEMPYEAGRNTRRSRGLIAPSMGPNSALAMSADELRRKSHALLRDNPWAFGGVESYVANAVGTGIQPQSQAKTSREVSAADEAFREGASELWLDWCDEADANGSTDFYGVQAQVARALIEAGECFVRFRPRRLSDGLSVPIQLQVLEAEHCPVTKNEPAGNGNKIVNGIEIDAIGRRVAYHMYRDHPDEWVLNSTRPETVPVPASEVLHVYRVLRPGQLRGEPWLARVILRLNDIDEYDNAELVRKKGAAHFGGVIETPDPDKIDESIGQLFKTTEDGGFDVTMQPGTWPVIPPGLKVENFEPADVGPNFDVFIEHQLRAIAAGLGITYEMLTGDMRNVNYSSARVAILEFRRRCEAFIWAVLVHQLNRPVWQRWMDLAVFSGALEARDYQTKRRAYQRVTWTPQGWQWVDPLREVTATILECRAGLKSVPEAIRERGSEPSQVEREITQWNQRADKDDRVHDTDPRKVTQTGVGVTINEGAADTQPQGGRRAA